MRFQSILLALSAVAPEAAAQADPAEAVGEAAPRGAIAYPASFFANARPSTALDMITRLPGFSLDQGDEARGFAGTAGNVLINGERPTTKSENLEDLLRRISASSVERIDLIRGGAAGIDMQGRTVMANVVIKRTVQVEKVVNLDTYAYPDGFLGPILELQGSRRDGVNELEGSMKATRDRTDQTYDGGVRLRRDGAGVATAKDAMKGYDLIKNYLARGAAQRAAFAGKARVNGKIEYFSYDRDVTARRVFPAPALEETGETFENWTGEFGARYDRALGPRTDLQLVLLQNLGHKEYGSTARLPGASSDYAEISKTGETILRAEGRQRRSDTLTFETSVEGAYNVLDGSARYAENGAAVPLPAAQVKVEELRGEASGKAIWRVLPKLSVEAGARLEVSKISQSGDTDQSKSFFYPKPRMLTTWSPTAADQLRLRLEREVGQLDFGDFVSSAGTETGTVDTGNPDLEPDRSWVAEAAWERRFWSAGALILTWRHAQITDVVDLLPINGADAPGNIGDGRSDEYVVNLTVPTAKLRVSGGQLRLRATWRQSSVVDPVTGRDRRISGQIPLECSLRFTRDQPGGRWGWGVGAQCPIEERYYRINEVRTFTSGAYFDSFVEWKPRPDFRVRAELSNLSSRERGRTRQLFAGSRASGQVVQSEERALPFEPYLFLRIRKSFG
ncbi:MAG: TonB-dependent receptor plug [Caulobacter sp.]|nr:TonB-dependent receptor plug [Caulobacter sp.]